MVQKNFILTDVMKTGNHIELEEFIQFADIEDQLFDMNGEWYRLNQYDLKKYNRRIALIHVYGLDIHGNVDTTTLNPFYLRDLKERIDYLRQHNFTIVLTNLWECEHFINEKFVLDKHKNDLVWGGGSVWFWHRMYQRYKDTTFNFYHNEKKYDFLYLNKAQRHHRDLLFDRLIKQNHLSQSLYSYHDRNVRLHPEYEIPAFKDKVYPRYGHDRDIYEKPYNLSKFNIVSETSVDELFFTEKIWKPIIAKQLFIVHGKQYYLKHLKELGFKTYGDFIDESYDNIESLEQRTDAIVKLCDELKGTTHIELYANTQEIREYNQKMFFSKEHLQNAIKKTINNLLKLIDSR